MPQGQAKPWEKYQAPSPGPWTKYAAPAVTSPQFEEGLRASQEEKQRALTEQPAGAVERFFSPAVDFLKGGTELLHRAIAPKPEEKNVLGRLAGPPGQLVQDVGTGLIQAQREAGQDYLEQTEPLKQVRGFFEAGVPLVGPLHRSLRLKAEQGDVAGALGEGALILAGGRSGGGVQAVRRGAAGAAEFATTQVPSRLINSILRTPKSGYRFGKNPGLAVAQEGLIANSEEGLLKAVQTKAAEIGAVRDKMLAGTPAKPIDVHKVIQDALAPEIQHAQNVGNRAAVKGLRNLQNDLLAQHPQSMTPLEATRLKTDLAKATNWTSDSNMMILNDGRRRIVNRLRFAVEDRVPKVGKLNERWGNMLEAEKALEGAIAIGERRNLVGMGDIAAMGAGALGGAVAGGAPEASIAGLSAVAARRALGSVPVKTRLAAGLARRQPPAEFLGQPPTATPVPVGLLPRPAIATPAPADTSFVRGVPAAYAEREIRGALPRPALTTPPPVSESFVRGVPAAATTGRAAGGQFKRVFTSASGPQTPGTVLGEMRTQGGVRWAWDEEKWYPFAKVKATGQPLFQSRRDIREIGGAAGIRAKANRVQAAIERREGIQSPAAQRASKYVSDEGLFDLSGNPLEVNADGTVTLYHRTTKANAERIRRTGRFLSKENTKETFFSNKPTGQGEGYGEAVVAVRIPVAAVRINDSFPHEIHVAVSNKKLGASNLINY